jgi:hypothetical protein
MENTHDIPANNVFTLYLELQEKRINKTITEEEKDKLLNICTLFLNDLMNKEV